MVGVHRLDVGGNVGVPLGHSVRPAVLAARLSGGRRRAKIGMRPSRSAREPAFVAWQAVPGAGLVPVPVMRAWRAHAGQFSADACSPPLPSSLPPLTSFNMFQLKMVGSFLYTRPLIEFFLPGGEGERERSVVRGRSAAAPLPCKRGRALWRPAPLTRRPSALVPAGRRSLPHLLTMVVMKSLTY